MNQEGAESARMIEVLAWIEVNKKRIAVGVIALGLVIGAIVLYSYFRDQAEAAASAALVKLQQPSSAGAEASAPTAAAFDQIAAQHSGTAAAARALLLAGETLFRERQFEAALTRFQSAASALRDPSLQALAALGVAASLDGAGKTNEAFAAYQDITLRHGSSPVASQAKLALAGIYEQRGDNAQALRVYNELTNTVTTAWATEALGRREILVARYPGLVSTNAVDLPVPAESTNAAGPKS